MMSKNLKVLFVQDAVGKLSETFNYRMMIGLHSTDVYVLTGAYVNREAFPFPMSQIRLWGEASLWQKIKGKINIILNLSGSHSGIGYKIIDEINKSDVDLVCFQFAYLPVNIGSDIDKIQKKICIIHHGSDVNEALENEVYRKRLKNVWQIVDKTIFVSHFLYRVGEKLGCPDEKSIVHYLGVPVEIKDIPGKNNDVFEFICVARMTAVKNHLRLIEAFSKVVINGNKKVKLTLIGEGELGEEIEQKIRTLELEGYVQLLGGLPNPQVLPLIQNADCIVLVSQIYIEKNRSRAEEGLPISLLEGASMGLPMIGSNTGGIPEIIEDKVNGLLVDPLSVDDMARAIQKMAEDKNKARLMGKNARLTVLNKFDSLKQNEKLEIILKKLSSIYE